MNFVNVEYPSKIRTTKTFVEVDVIRYTTVACFTLQVADSVA